PGRGSGFPRWCHGSAAAWDHSSGTTRWPSPERAPGPAAWLSSRLLRLRKSGQQLVLDDVVGQRADVFPADDSVGVDKEGLRCAVDAPVQCVATILVRNDDPVRIAELLQPAQCVGVIVLPVVTDDAHALALGETRDHRMFVTARWTPAAPDVQHECGAL